MRLSNALAALDELLPGPTRGWGAGQFTDPTLLYVTGFDAEARAFEYAVNPRFGRQDARLAALSSPYRVSVDVELFLGRPVPEQQASRTLAASPLNGFERLTVAQMRNRLRPTFEDPFDLVLQENDSLLLQRDQIEAIRDAQLRYLARVDSVWTNVAEHFAALPKRYDVQLEGRRLEEAYTAVIAVGWEETPVLREILLVPQLARVPGTVRSLLDRKRPLMMIR